MIPDGSASSCDKELADQLRRVVTRGTGTTCTRDDAASEGAEGAAEHPSSIPRLAPQWIHRTRTAAA